jgi:hypothetical protein
LQSALLSRGRRRHGQAMGSSRDRHAPPAKRRRGPRTASHDNGKRYDDEEQLED